jgi:hypothetical protein
MMDAHGSISLGGWMVRFLESSRERSVLESCRLLFLLEPKTGS